jgi:hypothetical protein
MTGLLPRLFPIPGPLVETGSTLVVVWEVAMRAGEAFGLGEGDGEGDAEGDGDGTGAWGISGVAVTGVFVDASTVVLVVLRTNPKTRTATTPNKTTPTRTNSFSGLRRGLGGASITESSTTTSRV